MKVAKSNIKFIFSLFFPFRTLPVKIFFVHKHSKVKSFFVFQIKKHKSVKSLLNESVNIIYSAAHEEHGYSIPIAR